MKKILLIANVEFTLTQFRLELIDNLLQEDCEVSVAFADSHWTFDTGVSLKDKGIQCYHYDLERNGINPLKECRAYKQLKKIIMQVMPDIVLNFTVKPAIYGSMAAHVAGVDNIYSNITGLGYVFTGKTFKHTLLRFCLKRMYAKALKYNKRVFFQNPDDLQLFLDCRLVRNAQPCLLHGSGINTKTFMPVQCSSEKISYLLITRLLDDKGVREYLEAATILKNKYDNISFKLMGPIDDNPSSLSLKDIEAMQQHHIIDYIEADKDIVSHLANASVYVFPSYREGTPRSVLEAMAMAKPIVTTDVPGCRETVVNGKNGFLVPARNAKALAVAMEHFVNNPALIDAMGRESRVMVEDKFDVCNVNHTILDAIGI